MATFTLMRTIPKGLAQTWDYTDTCGTKEGYLLIFSQAETVTWTTSSDLDFIGGEAEFQKILKMKIGS